jgi:excisionase family DNA binding protein
MSDEQTIKSTGGIAPFGYAWQDGNLEIDETEAPIRRLIYELFLKHRRKKTVAKLLNDLGYRTRNGSLFSDTTIDRLLRDTTAKGIKIIDGVETKVPAIISEDIWQRANNFLGTVKTKQPIHLFIGFAFCVCGGKMIVPSSSEKYVCLDCRHKIGADDLEEIFAAQLAEFPIESENYTETNLSEYWQDFSQKEKRIIIEQILEKMTVGKTDIAIEFGYSPHSHKTTAVGQQSERGNETPNNQATKENRVNLNEPLMSEIEAAKFLGISRMTLLRKRNANEIGFYKVGFRILYSKEKHLIPFLEQCEK